MRAERRSWILVFGVSVLVSLAGLSAWAQVSADDFLPPAQAKSEAERAALRAVKEGGGRAGAG